MRKPWVMNGPMAFLFLEAIEPALWLFLFWQFAEKVIFF